MNNKQEILDAYNNLKYTSSEADKFEEYLDKAFKNSWDNNSWDSMLASQAVEVMKKLDELMIILDNQGHSGGSYGILCNVCDKYHKIGSILREI